jgi:ribose transport system ATP-binding protein
VDASPILDASGVAKSYGSVAALRDASLAVRPGEVHALMGANGAGKSTLVKILTGAARADAGRILLRGRLVAPRTPADARRAGIVPVYQEPALIPDLDLAANLRLTGTPVAPFLERMRALGVPDVDLRDAARDLPLAVQRVADLARALAGAPDVLLLDEMTAALPADLAERVLDVIRREGAAGRAVIFISHRFLEISALCDRATVLRDGATVGVVDVAPGVEERIVELMLGGRIERAAAARRAAASASAPAGPPRLAIRSLRVGAKLRDVSFELRDGEALGVVALEGQGQDELFAALAGAVRPAGGAIEVAGRPVAFRHPADAIREGVALVPGDRAEGLLMQRSVRENVALPFSARLRAWGPIDARRERAAVDAAVARLQIDVRAAREVRRLSGGNQQKVTIARWIAAGTRTILCLDPTRGIDVRTKQEIYRLLRELAGQGASILFYTSELEEVPLVCDRVIVIFGGRVVDAFPAAIADEATLTRAAYGLPRTPAAATAP